MNFQQACLNVIRYCPDPYAKTYADAGLTLYTMYAGKELEQAVRDQCLYILSNAGKWRGDLARETKAVLKELSKEPKRGKK